MADFQTFSLGNVLGTASALRTEQLRQQYLDTQNQQTQRANQQSQAVDQLTQTNPNATLGDYAAAGGMTGVAASQQVSQARTADLTNHYRQLYTAATTVANSDDPIGTVAQVAPQFSQQYDAVHGTGAFSKLTPDQVKQQAGTVAQQALAGLVDPDKQFQAHQQMVEDHYKQEGNGGEAARTAATIAAENARSQSTIAAENSRNQFSQSQENARNDKKIAAENARSGFDADGTLNPKFDSTVQAILDYRASPFAGASARSGPGAAIMAEVNRRDPTYDASQYPAKAAALKSLTSGKDGTTLDQTNTAVQHLTQLKGLLAALNTGDIQAINQAKQAYQTATGNPAPTNAAVVANMAAGEVNKVVTGGPGAEGDRDLSRAAVQLKGSPEQQQGAMDQIIGLMAGRLNSTRNRFQQNHLGTTFDNMLLPETKAALAAHGYTGAAAPAAADTPTAAAITATGPNGEKITLQNGQWVPAK